MHATIIYLIIPMMEFVIAARPAEVLILLLIIVFMTQFNLSHQVYSPSDVIKNFKKSYNVFSAKASASIIN